MWATIMATFLPGTFSSSRSALWVLAFVSCLALLAGLYVWSCVGQLLVSLHSKLKSTENETFESVLPPSILNLQDYRQTIKKIVSAAIALCVVSGIGLWYALQGSQKTSFHYNTGGIEIVRDLGDGVWEVNFPGAKQTERIKPCGDPIVLKVGVMLKTLEYYHTGWCMYIGPDCEVDYLTDARGNVVDRNGRELFAKEN